MRERRGGRRGVEERGSFHETTQLVRDRRADRLIAARGAAQPKIGCQRRTARCELRQRSLDSAAGAMEAVLSGFEFICCMSARTKSAEQREYAHLRDALARKQAEVAKLQEQCDALRRDGDARTERYGAQYLQGGSATEETEEYTEDENAPPDALARR